MSNPMMQRFGPNDSDLSMISDLLELDIVLLVSNGNSLNIDLLSEDRKDSCRPMNTDYESFQASSWKLKTKNVLNWRRYESVNRLYSRDGHRLYHMSNKSLSRDLPITVMLVFLGVNSWLLNNHSSLSFSHSGLIIPCTNALIVQAWVTMIFTQFLSVISSNC